MSVYAHHWVFGLLGLQKATLPAAGGSGGVYFFQMAQSTVDTVAGYADSGGGVA